MHAIMTGEKTARAEVIELHNAWIGAEVENRPRDLLAFCCADIIIDPPGCQPIRGLEDAEALLVTSAVPVETVVIDQLEIDFVGGLAVKRARFSTHVCGATKPVCGRHLWVLRPRWKLAYLTWTIEIGL